MHGLLALLVGVLAGVGSVCRPDSLFVLYEAVAMFRPFQWEMHSVLVPGPAQTTVLANFDAPTHPPNHPCACSLNAAAAIEERNNQLERHSRNNQKLLSALEGLVDRLTLPPAAEAALQANSISAAK